MSAHDIRIFGYCIQYAVAARLAPKPGALERGRFNQLLTFLATEIADKHIRLIRKLMTGEGTKWGRDKLQAAYGVLAQQLDRRPPSS